MEIMGIFSWLLLGLIVGTIARSLFPTRMPGCLSIILGIGGSLVGGFLATLLGFGGISGFDIRSFIIALIGTITLLGAYSLISKASRTTVSKPLQWFKPKPQDRTEEGNTLHDPRRDALAPRAQGSTIQNKTIFISYRRDDSSDITGRIYDRLESHFGRANVFKDVDSIPLGVDFRRHLNAAVSACSAVIVVIGRQWLGQGAVNVAAKNALHDPGDFVRIEIEAALKRDIPLIPVLVQNAAMPAEESLPPSVRELRYRNWLEVRNDPDFGSDVQRLIRSLELHFQTSPPANPSS